MAKTLQGEPLATRGREKNRRNKTRLQAKTKPAPLYVPPAGTVTPLREWLETAPITMTELAKRCGVSLRTVILWRDGDHLPSLVVAFIVERETDGKVSLESWLQTPAGMSDYNRLTDAAGATRIREGRGRPRRGETPDSSGGKL